jgi:hypothetical protein
MVRPNVRCSYLLQIRPLEDTHCEHSGPQETTFPDYEYVSMPWEALLPSTRLSVNPWFLVFFRRRLSHLRIVIDPASTGISEESFQSLQGAKYPNQERISKNPDGKE